MTTGGMTGQDAENTRGSRGTEPTSTAAFRSFLRQADELIPELAAEARSETEVWQNFDDAMADLVADLYKAFRRRVTAVQAQKDALAGDDNPVEAPTADEQPSAVPG